MTDVGVFYDYPNELYSQVDESHPNILGFSFDTELIIPSTNSIKNFKDKIKNTLGFLILRFTQDISQPLNVYFRLSGSAILGKDYYVKGSSKPYEYETINIDAGYIIIPAFSNFYILTIFPKKIIGKFDYKTIVCRLFDVGDYELLEDNSYARSFILFDKSYTKKSINPKSNIFLPRESNNNLSPSKLKKYDTFFVDISNNNSWLLNKNESNITQLMDNIIDVNNNNTIQETINQIDLNLKSSFVNLDNRIPIKPRFNIITGGSNTEGSNTRGSNALYNSVEVVILDAPIYNNYTFNKKKFEFKITDRYDLFDFIVFGDIKLNIKSVILFILGKDIAPNLIVQINRYPSTPSDIIKLEKNIKSNILKLTAYYIKIDLFDSVAYSNVTDFTLNLNRGSTSSL